MTPAVPLPPGTLSLMDALLDGGDLSGRERDRALTIKLLALGREGKDVAEVVGCSIGTVYRRRAEFLAQGEAALGSSGWGGRRNAVLSETQEAAFVAEFEQAARAGDLVSATAMLAELQRRTARQVQPSTLYRMLARHGWRKVVPRPRHPDADPDRQEAFKETSQHWSPPPKARTAGR
jgi:transposase